MQEGHYICELGMIGIGDSVIRIRFLGLEVFPDVRCKVCFKNDNLVMVQVLSLANRQHSTPPLDALSKAITQSIGKYFQAYQAQLYPPGSTAQKPVLHQASTPVQGGVS